MCGAGSRNEAVDSPAQEQLARLLAAAVPTRSAESRAVLEAIVALGGRLRRADSFAASVRLGNRYRVARLLRREHLPQLSELAAWVRVLGWVVRSATKPISLGRIAIEEGTELSVCCRMIRRLTGVTWLEARRRGPEWLLTRMVARCDQLARRPRPRPGAKQLPQAG